MQSLTPLEDLVRIGEEDKPWFCSENYTYIVIHFVPAVVVNLHPAERHEPRTFSEADVLDTVQMSNRLSGCL
jgi:hypothetical protein